MNRKEANQCQGKTVLIDEGIDGIYFARLIEIIAPPKKTWKGKVVILGICEYPSSPTQIDPKYTEGQRLELPGSKIMKSEGECRLSYNESVQKAIRARVADLTMKENDIQKHVDMLEQTLIRFGGSPITTEKRQDDEDHVYYYLKKRSGKSILIEKGSGQWMELDGCPFELEIPSEHGNWNKAVHLHDFSFQHKDGSKIKLVEEDPVRIHKSQFEPYSILLNELERPSRDSLEKGLKSFGMSASNIKHCHNKLLHDLLQSDNQKTFSGVNVLLFQNQQYTLFVQHHFERELRDHEPDMIYDRFEFTTDTNERTIMTYSNMFATDR